MQTITSMQPAEFAPPALPPVSLEPLSSSAEQAEQRWRLRVDGHAPAELVCSAAGPELAVACRPSLRALDRRSVAELLEQLFAAYPVVDCLWFDREAVAGDATALFPLRRDGRLGSPRAGFYQMPTLWHRQPRTFCFPELRTTSAGGLVHPLRPPAPRGVVYERFDSAIGRRISFRSIDIDADLGRFHGWMNQGRVAYYWELAKPRDDLREYLRRLNEDPHQYGLIGCMDDEPIGYFEIYWAREDRLGPYYDADDYDRGWHGLIGSRAHLGRSNTVAVFRALSHYLFLDDPRTRRLVGEPRVDNVKIIRLGAEAAYERVKDFDFPHKRAALMCCRRERFFREVRL